jgi:hypothetical protein
MISKAIISKADTELAIISKAHTELAIISKAHTELAIISKTHTELAMRKSSNQVKQHASTPISLSNLSSQSLKQQWGAQCLAFSSRAGPPIYSKQ